MKNLDVLPWLFIAPVVLVIGAQSLSSYPTPTPGVVPNASAVGSTGATTSKLALTIELDGMPVGYSLPLEYLVYVDHRQASGGEFTQDQLESAFHRSGGHGRFTRTYDIEPGRHVIRVLLRVSVEGQCCVSESPFLEASKTADFEPDRVGEVRLYLGRFGKSSIMRNPLSGEDDGLDDLSREVKQMVEGLEHDKMYTELRRVMSARKGGRYVYLDIYGGCEFDRSQMMHIVSWLRRRYLHWLTDDLSTQLPVALMNLTDRQRKRYFDLLETIDTHSRALRHIEEYLNDLRIWKD